MILSLKLFNKNHTAVILDLQRTIGDMAKQLQQYPPDQFSGNTHTNPNAPVNAISTRSGKQLAEIEPPVRVKVEEEYEVEEEIELEVPDKVHYRQVPARTATPSGLKWRRVQRNDR